MAPRSGDRVGDVVGDRYRILSVVGSGGMATVYRARDEGLGREVALKVLRPGAEQTTGMQMQSEIDVLATLNHHSLVTLFDAGMTRDADADVPFFVMELVQGETLAERVATGPVNEVDAARMAGDLAEGLHVAHANGIVHRDVKPANVLLAPSGLPDREFSAKLADFGIAHLASAPRETRPGTFIGTVAYISPEQAQGADPAPPADVYSLGLVLLESMTGRRAFPGSTGESLVARVAADPKIPGSLSPEWRALVRAMTTRRPEERPTAAEVAGLARRLELLAAQARERGARSAAAPAAAHATAAQAAERAPASDEAPTGVDEAPTGLGEAPTGAGELPTGVGMPPTGSAEVLTGPDEAATGVGELSGVGLSPTAVLPVVATERAARPARRRPRGPVLRGRARGVVAAAASGALVLGITGAVYASLTSPDDDQRSGVAVRLDGPEQERPVLGSLVPAGGLDLEEGPQETEEAVALDPVEPAAPRSPVSTPARTTPAAKANPGASARQEAQEKGKGNAKKDKPDKAKGKGKGAGKNR